MVRGSTSARKRSSDHGKKTVPSENGQPAKFYRGVGCKKCRNTGYAGRIAIHELFVPDDSLIEMINDRVSTKQLREAALARGMVPLHSDRIEKVKAGIVSIEEVLRTAGSETQADPAV